MPRVIPVILSGGSGTRLWPLSRTETPKQFLRLMDDQTLLQKTAARAMAVSGASGAEIVTVTLESMRQETVRQLEELSPQLGRHVLGEPEARNTGAAIAYALQYVHNIFGGDSIAWILPADHHVGNEAALAETLHCGIEMAKRDYLVIFGITPTRPETGYGYIMKSGSLNRAGAFSVGRFVEKPAADAAEKFVASGEYLWNSGMHLFRTGAALESYRRHAPDLIAAVEKSLMESWNDQRISSSQYSAVPPEPFETAVLEKAERIAVIPCDPQWSDIGSWESLWEVKNKDGNGNSYDGKVVCAETKNSLILAHDRLVTCVGLNDVIVIETGDSVLVADRKCNGSLKALVQAMQKSGRKETRVAAQQAATWGSTRLLAGSPDHSLREVTIKPGQMRDPQIHAHKSGYIMITSGEALFIVDGARIRLKEKETFFIPAASTYSVANTETEDLKFYEFFYLEREKADARIYAARQEEGREQRHAAA